VTPEVEEVEVEVEREEVEEVEVEEMEDLEVEEMEDLEVEEVHVEMWRYTVKVVLESEVEVKVEVEVEVGVKVEVVQVEMQGVPRSSAASTSQPSGKYLCTFISLLLQGPSLPLLVP
jgi:hypothetical protein